MQNHTVNVPAPRGERPTPSATPRNAKNSLPNPVRIGFPGLDPERIFDATRQAGYLYCDLFCELGFQTRLRSQNRIEDVRFHTVQGAVLRAFDGHRNRTITTTDPTTEGLLKALGLPTPGGTPRDYFRGPIPVVDAAHTEDKFTFLTTFARQLWNDVSPVGMPAVTYEDSRRYTLTADSEGTLITGSEEQASIVAEWLMETEGKLVRRRAEHHRHDIESLLNDLKASPRLRERILNALADRQRWPAPQGPVPVLWSSLVFAKLNGLFLRAFEGDTFLAGRSFLSSAQGLPFRYRIEESIAPASAPTDHEGATRRTLVLLQDGKPRGLACNRHIAEQMGVASTGHARRTSYRDPATIALWAPRLIAEPTEDDLLGPMTQGLYVDDIEVLSFHTATGDIRFRLSEACLVHHGEKGEPIEPVLIDAHLPTLLQDCHQFSAATDVTGLRQCKAGQDFIVEITAPAALSLPLDIPGSVPPSNYW
jgi:predicted Zn-dependent protease